MLRFVFTVVVKSCLLTACVSSTQPMPVSPSPAVATLQAACSGGNVNACGQLAQIEAQNRETEQARQTANSAYWTQWQSNQTAQSAGVADAYWGPQRARAAGSPQTATCRDTTLPGSQIAGQIVCTTH